MSDGPIVWVSEELDRQWREEPRTPRPGHVLVAEVVVYERPMDDRPPYCVAYTLTPLEIP